MAASPSSAGTRLAISIGLGIVVSVALWAVTDHGIALLSGIVVLETVFVISSVVTLWPMSPQQTRDSVSREGFRPGVQEVVVLALAAGSVGGIAVLQVLGQSNVRDVAAALGLMGVFATWAMVQQLYATRYAHEYYDDPVGGIDFNDDDQQSFRDFMYFSYNLGMTYAVSDNNISTTELRAVVLRHALFSWIFGTVILAATINLVTGIATG